MPALGLIAEGFPWVSVLAVPPEGAETGFRLVLVAVLLWVHPEEFLPVFRPEFPPAF